MRPPFPFNVAGCALPVPVAGVELISIDRRKQVLCRGSRWNLLLMNFFFAPGRIYYWSKSGPMNKGSLGLRISYCSLSTYAKIVNVVPNLWIMGTKMIYLSYLPVLWQFSTPLLSSAVQFTFGWIWKHGYSGDMCSPGDPASLHQ